MPECAACGNRKRFLHGVSGTVKRRYLADTGEFVAEYDDQLTTEWTECAECGSEEVYFD